MSKNYPLITKGTHIILDIYEIDNIELLKFTNIITEIMDDIVNEYKLNVVGKLVHQFQPYGVTGAYILSESHLSLHSFVDEKKISIDLYTCSKSFENTLDVIEFIKNKFKPCLCNYKIIDR